MNVSVNKSRILHLNAQFFGINLKNFYTEFGETAADLILKNFGGSLSITILCGLGGNGTDGLALTLALAKKTDLKISLLIYSRAQKFENEYSREFLDELYTLQKTKPNLHIKQEAEAKDIVDSDIIIEALSGTGYDQKELLPKIKSLITKINRSNAKKIAIDIALPGYKVEQTISIDFPKTKEALCIKMNYPNDLEFLCGPGDAKCLIKPKEKTHKSKNGTMLILFDSNNLCHSEPFGVMVSAVPAGRQGDEPRHHQDKLRLSTTTVESLLRETIDIAKLYGTRVSYYDLFTRTGNLESTSLEEELSNVDVVLLQLDETTSDFITDAVLEKIFKSTNAQLVLPVKLMNLWLSCNFDVSEKKPAIFLENSTNEVQRVIKNTNLANLSTKAIAVKLNAYILACGYRLNIYTPFEESKLANMPLSSTKESLKFITALGASLATLNDPQTSLASAIFFTSIAKQIEKSEDNIIPGIKKGMDLVFKE